MHQLVLEEIYYKKLVKMLELFILESHKMKPKELHNFEYPNA